MSTLNKLFDLSDISPKTQQHLSKVYANVFAMCLICATGMYINANYIATGFLSSMVSIAASLFLVCHVVNR